MRFMLRGAAFLALIVGLGSCSDRLVMNPDAASSIPLRASASHLPPVRISEIHYDNDGTDAGEAVEISAPGGTDLTGWSLVLYNGSNGLAYSTTTLTGTVAASCDARGVIVVNYPVNGIQNGSPDGIALVDAAGVVIEYLTYEGAFAAVDGPAAGMTGVDIGVSETASTTPGHSLQLSGSGGWNAPAASTFGSCNDAGAHDDPPPPPPPPAATNTFISELHYDNASTDVDEAVEIEGPAGTDVTGWRVLLYNGNGGAQYASYPLNGAIPASCGDRGVVSVLTPGIQNGNPDGVALVTATDSVVEFISYGGVFVAVGGPAGGMTSVNIGVTETASTTVGHSLQRNADGVWEAPQPATFGTCNGGVTPPPPPPITGDIVIHELMGDPANAESASWGEWFEVHNRSTSAIDLQGWTIASGGASQPAHVIAASVIVPAGGYAVLGRGGDVSRNGGVALDYNYFAGSATTIWLDNSDWLALRDGAGATVDSVQWTSLSRGATKAVRDAALDNTSVDGSNWGWSSVTFGAGDYGTPGAANGTLTDAAPAVRTVSFTGRSGSDPALPVGFEDQLFATLRDESGNVVLTTFTWTSETPALASVDARGVVLALGAGTAIIRATAADGTSGTFPVPAHAATASASASYLGNAEFGEPLDADASDDFIVRRAQYTASYNSARGTPNWVSYNLEATHFGPEDRCDCFTHDPALPAGFSSISTADYTGAGAFHGYGIDRGHLVRSADRTSASLDNAVTYYFSNIIPQAADQNQGPWAILENTLGDRARAGTSEVYVVTGIAGAIGTLKDEGKVVIPAAVWKVAVILPRDHGLAHVTHWGDLEVIAVMMPNIAGIRNIPWQNFTTTVDDIEAASGYDLLALLPDHIERVVESGTRAPVAAVNGPFAGAEGSAIALSGGASSDPDGDALTFAWSFGDGSGAAGSAVTHTYAQDGSYTVRLIVTDPFGAADTVFTSATVQNVTPSIAALAPATLLPGEAYSVNGSFTDPGADPWSATVDYGDGTGVQPLALNGKNFVLSHAYATAGTFSVTVRVTDDDITASRVAAITVLTQLQAVRNLSARVTQAAADGDLTRGATTALRTLLSAAATQLEGGNTIAAAKQLEAFANQVLTERGIGVELGRELQSAAERIVRSL